MKTAPPIEKLGSWRKESDKLKDPCSEFSKVGILHVRPVKGHFWSPRSPKEKKIFKKNFLGGEIDLQNFF